MVVDGDGVARRIPIICAIRKDSYEALSVSLAELGGVDVTVNGSSGPSELVIGTRRYPLERGGSFRFYVLPLTAFEPISYADILNGTYDIEKELKGAVVVMGLDMAGRGAHYLTSLQKQVLSSSLEVQASAVNALYSGWVMARQGMMWMIVTLGALCLLVGIAVSRLATWSSSLFTGVLIIGYSATAILAISQRLLLDTLFVPAGMLLTFAGTHALLHARETHEKRRVAEIFGRYLKPEIVEQLLESPEEALDSLKGIKREISVLFADIRGFTPFAEEESSEEVVSVLNEYLRVVSEVIFAYDGTIDKYIGDAVMAFFNAPQDQPDHVPRAVACAKAIVRETGSLGARSRVRLHFGVGVHVGEAVIGNIGGPRRLEYTAIGDTVNLAARLCGEAKGGQVLLTQEVRSRLESDIMVEPLGLLAIKGRRRPVEVYAVVESDGTPGDNDDTLEA